MQMCAPADFGIIFDPKRQKLVDITHMRQSRNPCHSLSRLLTQTLRSECAYLRRIGQSLLTYLRLPRGCVAISPQNLGLRWQSRPWSQQKRAQRKAPAWVCAAERFYRSKVGKSSREGQDFTSKGRPNIAEISLPPLMAEPRSLGADNSFIGQTSFDI